MKYLSKQDALKHECGVIDINTYIEPGVVLKLGKRRFLKAV